MVKTILSNTKAKATAVAIMFMCLMVPTMCDPGIMSGFGKIWDNIIDPFTKVAGAVMGLVGLYNIAMGIKDVHEGNNRDGFIKGFFFMIGAIIILAAKSILNAIGISW